MNDPTANMMMDSIGHPTNQQLLQQQQQQQQQQTMREYTTSADTDLTATRSASLSPASPSPLPATYSTPLATHAANNTPPMTYTASSFVVMDEAVKTSSPNSSPPDKRQPTTADPLSFDINMIGTEMWFKSIYHSSADQDGSGRTATASAGRHENVDSSNRQAVLTRDLSPVSYLSHRPFVDDSHRLRYQDIEDETHSNESEENNHQGKLITDPPSDFYCQLYRRVVTWRPSSLTFSFALFIRINRTFDPRLAFNLSLTCTYMYTTKTHSLSS